MDMLIRLRFVPEVQDDYDTARFAAAGRALVDAFAAAFGGRCSALQPVTDGAGKKRWHVGADARTADPSLLVDAHRWLQSGAATGVRSAHVKPAVGGDPETIGRARWVELLGDTRGVASAKYAVGCAACGRLRYESPPTPFTISEKVAKAPKREIFDEGNAVFVVADRVRSIFNDLAPGEFDEGAATVADRDDLDGKYFWVRPKQWIGPVASRYWSDPCGECGVPTTRTLKYDEYPATTALLRSFGRPQWNVARVGQWPFVNPKIKAANGQPSATLGVAVSGGLLAALQKEKVAGLVWPSDGPFISVDADEPILEAAPRFAAPHGGTPDRKPRTNAKAKK